MQMAKETKALVTYLYPMIEKTLATHSSAFKHCIDRFMSSRQQYLFDTAPCDRIYFGQNDLDDFYDTFKLSEKEIIDKALSKTYYYGISNFNPRAAKDPFTVAVLMMIRYFFLKNKTKELDLAMIYLAFSGKFYPSIHYALFRIPPSEHRYVMDYVVNNELSAKYDLKSQGHIFGAIKSISNTWINTYKSKFKSMDDEDAVYLIQQLHNRIKSFMKNIASLYYAAYENKDYLTYDSEDFSDENYRLVGSDSIKAQKAVDKAMNTINTSDVDYKLCKMGADANVKTEEIKSIMQTILSDESNLPQIKEFVTLLVYTYFVQAKDKDVRNIDFITFSITPKPNTKDKHLLRERDILESWLNETSPAYRKRKHRIATKMSYHKAVLLYFTLLIHNSNK